MIACPMCCVLASYCIVISFMCEIGEALATARLYCALCEIEEALATAAVAEDDAPDPEKAVSHVRLHHGLC